MRSFTMLVASASLFVSSCVFAAPETKHSFKNKRPSWYGGRSSTCMSGDEAQGVATNFKNLIAAYSDTLANSVLTVDFVDYSDSVIELINNGCPNSPVAVSGGLRCHNLMMMMIMLTVMLQLGTATFDSRASFEAGQSAQPAIPFKQLNIWYVYIHTCMHAHSSLFCTIS